MRSWFAALLCAAAPAWAGFSQSAVDFGLVSLGMPPPTFVDDFVHTPEVGTMAAGIAAAGCATP